MPALIASIIMGVGIVTFLLGIEKAYKRRKKRKESEEIVEIDLMELVPLWADANKHVIEVEAQLQVKKESGISQSQETSAQNSSAVRDKPNETPQLPSEKPEEPPASQKITSSVEPAAAKPELPAQKVAPPIKPEDKSDHPFRRKVEELIKPYKNFIDGMGARKPIDALIDMLIKSGDCPSIAGRGNKYPARDKTIAPSNFYGTFEQVSLAEHSFQTVRFLIDELRAYSQNYKGHVPGGVVAALGHATALIDYHNDSKIKRFSKFDCDVLSYQIVEKLLGDEILWRDKVTNAIEHRHENTSHYQAPSLEEQEASGITYPQNLEDTTLTICLKEAARKAREYEVSTVENVSGIAVEKWLDKNHIAKILSIIANKTNTVPQVGDMPKILSVGSAVFCPLSDFFEILRDEMWAERLFDNRLFGDAYQNNVTKPIIVLLPGMLERPWPITLNVVTSKGNYVLPKSLVFKTTAMSVLPAELEKRLETLGLVIESVTELKRRTKTAGSASWRSAK